MKTFSMLLISLFAANVYGATLQCTTRLTNVSTGSTHAGAKVCGAISQGRLSDNGVKYEHEPRLCKEFKVDFFSIRKGDPPKFTKYCETISAKSCFMIRVHDHKNHQGLGGLESYIVFHDIDAVPTVFSVNARAIARPTRIHVSVGRVVELSLRCRKRK
jgi:hypothetical protein